nr:sterol uptake control protein 2 [Quercus suber]
MPSAGPGWPTAGIDSTELHHGMGRGAALERERRQRYSSLQVDLSAGDHLVSHPLPRRQIVSTVCWADRSLTAVRLFRQVSSAESSDSRVETQRVPPFAGNSTVHATQSCRPAREAPLDRADAGRQWRGQCQAEAVLDHVRAQKLRAKRTKKHSENVIRLWTAHVRKQSSRYEARISFPAPLRTRIVRDCELHFRHISQFNYLNAHRHFLSQHDVLVNLCCTYLQADAVTSTTNHLDRAILYAHHSQSTVGPRIEQHSTMMFSFFWFKTTIALRMLRAPLPAPIPESPCGSKAPLRTGSCDREVLPSSIISREAEYSRPNMIDVFNDRAKGRLVLRAPNRRIPRALGFTRGRQRESSTEGTYPALARQISMNVGSHRAFYGRGRKAHHKCDEQTPVCSGCKRHSTECRYPNAEGRRDKIPMPSIPAPDVDVDAPLMRGLPIAPAAELNLGDLELWHQYLTCTCISTGKTPEAIAYDRELGPRLGLRFPFVMHGMLAMAATHLSRLRPASGSRYAIMAVRHQIASIADFRAALPSLNQNNYQALILYAKSLLWCSFATDEDCESQIALQSNDWLPRWFWLLHGSCQVVESARSWINDGPHTLYKPDRRIYETSPSSDDCRIGETMRQILARIGSDSMCSLVFTNLREAFARASLDQESTPLRNGMNTWVGSLSGGYIQLLRDEEPWALVALAFFCVLVDRSETVWFMKGHAKPLLVSIITRLDTTWRHHVDWPVAELGLDGIS